jgi:hypothetical protein
MSYCEDAPCCGCCGTGVWGNNNPEPMDSHEWFGDDEDYYGDDDYADPSTCTHDNNLSNICPLAGTVTCDDCDTDGVCFSIMGENVYRFPVTVSDDYGNEDAAMESSLFGDC